MFQQETGSRQLLSQAKLSFEKGDFSASFKESREILTRFPQKYGDQALYIMGLIYADPEYLYAKYEISIYYFDRLVKEYPKSALKSEAKIWIGLLNQNMDYATRVDNNNDQITSLKNELSSQKKQINNLLNQIKQLKEIDLGIEEKKERPYLKSDNNTMSHFKGKILVVDDDRNILEVIKMRLVSGGYQVTTTGNAKEALNLAEQARFDLLVLDLKLDEGDGISLMEDFHQTNPNIPVIILTAYGTIKSAVNAMKKGAYGYLTKPFEGHELLLQIDNCLEKKRLSQEVESLRQLVKKKYGFDNIIGKSEKMKKVFEQVTLAAATDSNVYIEGKSGTGKELIAKNLHVASNRKDGPFIAVNCAAIPDTLMESELFGYEKGAFTGANKDKRGLFAEASGGTFFLDEISEMSLSMQAKILRALEEKEFYPVGSRQTIKVDARIIAASNKNLEQEVEKGLFREDLFYRIHVIPIKLPPLQERKEDIPLLSRHFLQKYSKEMGKDVNGFSINAMQKLISYPWPGNIRELENTIECAVAMTKRNIITQDFILPSQESNPEGLISFKDAKENFEKNYLIQLFELTRGNVSKAAKLAGKYRADVYELIKKYNLKITDFRNK